jgi:predicted transcriptional regulator
MDDAEEAVVRLAEALQVGLGSDEKLRDRIRRQREQIEELKARLRKDEDTQVSQKPELESFLSDEDVRAQIEEAKKEASSPRYVKGVIATLLQAEGGVSYEEIAQHLGLETTSHVGTAVNALSDRGIIRKEKNGRQSIVFLNLDGLHEIRKTARRRRQTERLIDQL